MSVVPGELKRRVEDASAHVDGGALLRLVAQMIEIPSPTGEEGALAEFLVALMRGAGLDAFCQPLDDHQANAIGRLRGSGGGPTLILYSPIDTAFAGTNEDEPWIDLGARPDQVARSRIEGRRITGLGAHNPKGHGACLVTAALALKRARIPLKGDVIVALCAGGMPSNRRARAPGRREAVGHGAGCAFMLQQGLRGDFAIVGKPGSVSWEEVGVAWFRIRVNGHLGYAGTRHVMKHKNPILDAMKVVAGLEAWFPQYTARNTSGLVAPQGSIGYIRAGWPNKPTFVPSVCEIALDLRLSPRTTPETTKAQFAAAIDDICSANPDLDLDWEMTLAVPGTTTDPASWIVGACVRAFETTTGKAFEPGLNTSGATEANVLRQWGVPTAKMGLPPPPEPLAFAGMFSMGEAHADSLAQFTRMVLSATVDTCGRPVDACISAAARPQWAPEAER